MNTDKKTQVRSTVEALSVEDTLKLALEALEVATTPLAKDRQEVLRARAAIRAALASKSEALAEQPAHQQEPVAWLFTNVQSGYIEASTDPYDKQGEREYWHPAPLYTSPPASKPWVGLTDDERGQVYSDWRWNGSNSSNLELCQAIEAKLKEKNGF